MDYFRNTPKKGQTSVENLIMYAVTVFVAIVVILLLWQYQVFSPLGGSRGFVGFSQVVPNDWVIGSDKAYVSLKNIGESIIEVDVENVNISVEKIQCNLVPAASFTIEPGESYVVISDCPGLNSRFEFGEYMSADVTINYTNLVSGRRHLSVGKLYAHMEAISGWTSTTRTVTTVTRPPYCFNHPCDDPGIYDEDCGEIIYRGVEHLCMYCPVFQNPDGSRRCWYNGECGNTCFFDRDCSPFDPLNKCKKCVSGTCEEVEDVNQCGPCPLADAYTLTSDWCNVTECAYCYREWIPNEGSTLPDDGEYSSKCNDAGECGNECDYIGYDDYTDCIAEIVFEDNVCPHCQQSLINPTEGVCSQGDCGKHCGFTGAEECNEGCAWCNLTTFKCSLGSCGKFCVTADECDMGCYVCLDNTCVKTDIGLVLTLYNGTYSPNLGKVVNTTIPYLINVSAYSADGIDKILVSNNVSLPAGYESARAECNNIADEINNWFQTNGYPNPEDASTLTALNTWNITEWTYQKDCFGSPTCKEGWTSMEGELGSYCHFAITQKSGVTERWSKVVGDYIQVGYIDVYLIWPPPGSGHG